MNDLLQNIDNISFPKYKEVLIIFYAHFLKYKYKKSKLFSYFMDVSRHSFEHLYNFKSNKNCIIKDIHLNNFNSIFFNELFGIEKSNTVKEKEVPLSFYFEHKTSIISISLKKIKLNEVILFFSFQIGKEEKSLENIYDELPLIIIKNKDKDHEVFFQIFLKKIRNIDTTKYNLSINYVNTIMQGFLEGILC